MTKAILIQGCSTCPHARKFDEDIENRYWCLDQQDLDLGENLPKTPHPDCKLPDLPTSEEIIEAANEYPFLPSKKNKNEDFENGATFIINKLK